MTRNREPIFGPVEWSEKFTFVPALRVGDTVWISGTTGTDDNSQIVAPGDVVEQTRQIFRKFEKLLKSIGASCDDIVATTDFITTTENYRKTAQVRREFFKNGFPTSTGVIVAGLLREGAVIEISAVAKIGNGAHATVPST
jgi:enamine deaminase RidA (YjgF/YER057c/UK114 family)